ncbi:MAG: hypothetical protein P8O03_03125 [Ilumatobacter sp.]|nr:hypothetical protein [Ilumatobacter sp.]
MSDRIQAKLVACPHCSEVFPPSELKSIKQFAGFCGECGDWFESQHPYAQYCSRPCQVKGYRRATRSRLERRLDQGDKQ